MSVHPKNNIISNRNKIKDRICTNCGSKSHVFNQCDGPVTSWGVILVTYGDLQQPIHDAKIDLSKKELNDTESRVLIESNIDRMTVSKAYYNLMFLMISRKHSVGYVEFIRGRYRPEKIDQVIYLFKQMMQIEIEKINYSLTIANGFEYLWNDFWGNKSNSPYLIKNKITSRGNYEMLRVKGVDGPELDLKYIVSTVKAEYEIEEWGFPKGRRNQDETEEECALREFKEESGYLDEDIRLIPEIKPLVEEFIGTNGIEYRHVYYVAELVSSKLPRNDVTESQKDEIGNVKFMDFVTALECIRDYHVPRKVMLGKLFTYYLDKLVISNRTTNIEENQNEGKHDEETQDVEKQNVKNQNVKNQNVEIRVKKNEKQITNNVSYD